MPPPQKELKLIDGQVRNMYELMPKKFQKDVFNPNMKLHGLNMPFRLCVVAPTGSGKTNFISDLIDRFCHGNGTFNTITIITRNKHEPLYEWIEDKYKKAIPVYEGMQNTPDLDKFDKKENHLVIWDDLVLEKNLKPVEEYYIRARKLNCSVIFLSQSYFQIPKIIRSNCSDMAILELKGNRDRNLIMSEFGLGINKQQLDKIYKYATQNKFGTLLIKSGVQNPFYSGFLENIPIPPE